MTPTPTPPPASATTTLTILAGSTATASLGPVGGGYSLDVVLFAASNGATVGLTLSRAQPAGSPALGKVRVPRAIGGQNVTPILFVTESSNVVETFSSMPALTASLPFNASALGPYTYVAYYDPSAAPQPGWIAVEGPGIATGNQLTFSGTFPFFLNADVTYQFALVSSSGALPITSPAPRSAATPSPTPTPAALSVSPTTVGFPKGGSYGAQTVQIGGGVPPYSASVSDQTVAQAVLQGSVLSIGPVLNSKTGQYNAGTTTISVADAANARVTVQVGVTTSSLSVESRRSR